MDPAGLSNLLPLGGASVLLIYLLRLISYERQRWIRERATLIQECRDSIKLKDAEMARRDKENDRILQQWRDRFDQLRKDYERLIELHEQSATRERNPRAEGER